MLTKHIFTDSIRLKMYSVNLIFCYNYICDNYSNQLKQPTNNVKNNKNKLISSIILFFKYKN